MMGRNVAKAVVFQFSFVRPMISLHTSLSSESPSWITKSGLGILCLGHVLSVVLQVVFVFFP